MKTAKKPHTIVFNSKGQVVIPAAIRRRLSIEDGTTATVREENGSIVIHPVTETYVESLRGFVKKSIPSRAETGAGEES
jgi:AbrB family looped-hinge helix DNA binding protein